MSDLVLVTGGSGFIAQHCILALLREGYRVRTTARSLGRRDEIVRALRSGGATQEEAEAVELVPADLLSDEGWAGAMAGCTDVLHVASPFPLSQPKDPDELIRPAREGTLRALRHARDAGVRRVVLTSSFAAVGYGHEESGRTYDETTWSDPDGPGISAYAMSKTLAERAAWDFVEREGGDLGLSVVNPVAVFGPALTEDISSSVALVRRMLDGAIPAVPRIALGVVDVRDVADLHILAMTRPEAAGERFLATAGDFMTMLEISRTLASFAAEIGVKVPRRQAPDWAVRLLGRFDADIRGNVGELGRCKNATSAKAHDLLGWSPRTSEEALLASARSLVDLGLIERRGAR